MGDAGSAVPAITETGRVSEGRFIVRPIAGGLRRPRVSECSEGLAFGLGSASNLAREES